MAKIFITRNIPRTGPNLLRDAFGEDSIDIFVEERVMRPSELRAAVAGTHALLCNPSDRIDTAVIHAAGEELSIIATYSVALGHIDLAEATRHGIAVTHTPNILTESIADMTWALLMAAARRVVEADRFVRNGSWKGWRPHMLLGADVHGKTLGLFGIDAVGEAVIRRASGFDMRILYCDPKEAAAEHASEPAAHLVNKQTLLAESDFISIHCPLTPATRHAFGTREFRAMKPTAYLINTAYGAIVDEQALVEALKREEILGAALDVYESSPRLHPDLFYLENVVLSPRIASASIETRENMSRMAAESIVARLNGETPPYCVNPEVL